MNLDFLGWSQMDNVYISSIMWQLDEVWVLDIIAFIDYI